MPDTVEVRSRATLVAAHASLYDLSSEERNGVAAFVELARPMPVGATLNVTSSSWARDARVSRVAELPEHGHAGRLGCYLAWAGEAVAPDGTSAATNGASGHEAVQSVAEAGGQGEAAPADASLDDGSGEDGSSAASEAVSDAGDAETDAGKGRKGGRRRKRRR